MPFTVCHHYPPSTTTHDVQVGTSPPPLPQRRPPRGRQRWCITRCSIDLHHQRQRLGRARGRLRAGRRGADRLDDGFRGGVGEGLAANTHVGEELYRRFRTVGGVADEVDDLDRLAVVPRLGRVLPWWW